MNSGPWQSLPERIGRLEATIESLIRDNGELRRRVDNATEAEQILRRAQAPPAPPPAAHRRDRHGLHVVRGLVAAAGLATGWVLRSRGHKAATLALMAVVAAAGAGTPSMITGTPPSSAPSRAHRPPPRMPAPAVPARPRRRSTGRGAIVTSSPSPPPAATASQWPVDPQPSPMVPVTPLPSPLPSPLPVPSPLCVQLADQACDHNPNCVCGPDGDGDADDVLAAA